ncbi:hypothetical protein [Streptococcus alactolyticus]|uniref:hypothetical protein n=1 Tax=Streptococcus alactolyticus TaxID=29389 RepID=UPI00143F45AE|nr:hypothetical protein [Streptococcus alactolyticus]NKN40436.1 hypothetical protein [Streptococcus alactolyticus]NKN85160.1 hypothetical protein [Streptococcus agalactiae]
MKKGGNKMRAKYSVTHYETYSKTVLDILDEFIDWLYSKGISEPEDVAELLGISAYKARKLQRLEDLPNEKVKKMMLKVMKNG